MYLTSILYQAAPEKMRYVIKKLKVLSYFYKAIKDSSNLNKPFGG